LNYIPSDDPIISPEDDDPGFFKIPFWQGVRQVAEDMIVAYCRNKGREIAFSSPGLDIPGEGWQAREREEIHGNSIATKWLCRLTNAVDWEEIARYYIDEIDS